MHNSLKPGAQVWQGLMFLIVFTLSFTCTNAQILTNWPCHAVAEESFPNYYFMYDPATNAWSEVGSTNTSNIEAIAINPILNILYATDRDDFGFIDQSTGLFTIISDVGTGEGSLGTYDFDDIDGLSYDPVRDVVWASERREGGSTDLDLLFQINPTTGLVVPDVFGPGIDYVEIPAVTDPVSATVYHDIDDIAYNSYTGVLYAIQNQGGTGGVLTILDYNSMGTPTVVGSFPVDDMEGLGINYFGDLYGSTGDNGPDPLDSNRFFFINHGDGTVVELVHIDPTDTRVDFESFDCFSAYNDLALIKELSAAQVLPILRGDTVTFDITVTNQGNMPNSNIVVTDYIPAGLTLVSDPNWILNPPGTFANYTIIGPLNPTESVTISISFTVDMDAPSSITNTAEVSHSEYPAITPPIILPDIDATNDTIPDNDTVVDNETGGGGPHTGEDEDDHDIAVISIEDSNPCQTPGCDPVPMAQVCADGTGAVTLSCDAALAGVTWYNGNGDNLGTDCDLIIDNTMVGNGTVGQTQCFYYEATDAEGCPANSCCPVIVEVIDCCIPDQCIGSNGPFEISKN